MAATSTAFKDVLGKAEAEENTTSCRSWAKLLKKHVTNLSRWSAGTEVLQHHFPVNLQGCMVSKKLSFRAVVHLFIVIHPPEHDLQSHLRVSFNTKMRSCNFGANKDATHLYCRNSLFGKAVLDWQRLGTSLPKTWRRSATSPWSSSRPSTTRWAWSWRGTASRGCGDEVPCVASPLQSPSCPPALKEGAYEAVFPCFHVCCYYF